MVGLMNSNSLVFAFGAAVLVSIAISLFSGIQKGTIQSFFWGDQKISFGLTASLILTSSFSLNGLLYQAWLGFSIGWLSLLVQAVWCAGFVILVSNVPRFQNILGRGTMHAIIASRFGNRAGKLAAIASIVGFAILVGWESVVGATLLKNAVGANTVVYIALPLALVVVASLYTSTGGLRGNAIVNAVQNVFKGLILISSAILLVKVSPLGWGALSESHAARTNWDSAVQSLGGIALLSNFVFSFFWQAVDMSNWQNLAATEPDRRTRSIWAATIAVFIFPGLVGSVIGIALSSLPNISPAVTDANILNQFLEALSQYPSAVILLSAAFAASMMSAIDGYALAASQAATWDLIFPDVVKNLLSKGADREASIDDHRVLAVGRVIVLLVALLGASTVMALVIAGGISLFDIVYVVVIAQMSLVGPVIVCLISKFDHRIEYGSVPIILGLLCGGLLVAQRFIGNPDLYVWAPAGAVFASLVLAILLNYWSPVPKTNMPQGGV